jgi:hypothetical protein
MSLAAKIWGLKLEKLISQSFTHEYTSLSSSTPLNIPDELHVSCHPNPILSQSHIYITKSSKSHPFLLLRGKEQIHQQKD